MYGLRRLFQIGFAVCAYLLWWLLVHLRLWRPAVTPAQRLCRMVGRLGTTFVKLGQGLSLDRDLLPDEYIRALQGLQDHVAPFPDAVARRKVEQALGKSIAELFAEFEAHPMAAASIAQVHQARLHDGRRVVVKIRRPHIKSQIDRDMRLLRGVLRVLLALFPRLRRYDPSPSSTKSGPTCAARRTSAARRATFCASSRPSGARRPYTFPRWATGFMRNRCWYRN